MRENTPVNRNTQEMYGYLAIPFESEDDTKIILNRNYVKLQILCILLSSAENYMSSGIYPDNPYV